MSDSLNMFWDQSVRVEIPSAGSPQSALHVFNKNLAVITWNSLAALEKNSATLSQTETILNGQSVSGITIHELMQVKNFGEGARELAEMVGEGAFSLNEETACKLHGSVGKEDALTWGIFRNSSVTIRGIDHYNPPESEQLKGIAQRGYSFLGKSIKDPLERAIATFLFMARTQFFHDANKRTSVLMLNGVLMSNGLFPITVMNRDSEEFHIKLREFYNTGNATKMMDFFEKSIKEMYPQAEERQNGKAMA